MNDDICVLFICNFYSTYSSREMADIPGRWSHLSKLLERPGPLAHPEFEPNPEVNSLLRDSIA